MRRTPICLDIPQDAVLLRRLKQIVAADPRLQLRPYHRRGRSEHDPWYKGYGPGAGYPLRYYVVASGSVTPEDLAEIGAALD